MKKEILLIAIFVSVVISGCADSAEKPTINYLTSGDCESKGGRIVDTLAENCTDSEINIGIVEDLNCPCICCVPS